MITDMPLYKRTKDKVQCNEYHWLTCTVFVHFSLPDFVFYFLPLFTMISTRLKPSWDVTAKVTLMSTVPCHVLYRYCEGSEVVVIIIFSQRSLTSWVTCYGKTLHFLSNIFFLGFLFYNFSERVGRKTPKTACLPFFFWRHSFLNPQWCLHR